MKSFLSPQKVLLSADIIIEARLFAKAVVSTVNYEDSHQSVQDKIQDDHFISKLGEEAVKKFFTERGNKVTGPDYNIYDKNQKSWEADLIVNEIEMAVKTQKKSAADKYGLSWTFQNSSSRKDPILQHPEAWVCFVACDDASEEFSCLIFPPRKIKDLTFGEPRLDHLKGNKKVVYADDLFPRIMKAGNDLWR